MKRLTSALALTALAVLASPAAQAQWYMGADAGVNIQSDEKFHGQDTDGSTWSDKSGSRTGYAVQMHGGYDFGGPKAELELAYRGSGLKSLAEVNDGKVSGATTSLSVMANGVYQFLPQAKLHPFVGAGIGMARIGADWKKDSERLIDDTAWTFAYQGFAGLAYDIDKNWDVTAQYRYFGTTDADLKSSDGNKVNLGYHSHALLAGVTYKFGDKK